MNRGEQTPAVATVHDGPDGALKAAIHAAVDAGQYDRAIRLLEVLRSTPDLAAVLDLAQRRVTKACGLTKHITPRAMRRTFKDVSREAGLNAVVAKAISGHQTDAMHLLYLTAQVERGLAKVVNIATRRPRRAKTAQWWDGLS